MNNIFSNKYFLGAAAAFILSIAYYGYQSSNNSGDDEVAEVETESITEAIGTEATAGTAEVSNSPDTTDENNPQENTSDNKSE